MNVNKLPAINSPLLFSYCEVGRKAELAAMKQQLRIAINFFAIARRFCRRKLWRDAEFVL
jgi:hypothetical protein